MRSVGARARRRPRAGGTDWSAAGRDGQRRLSGGAPSAARALGRLVPSLPALAAYDPNDDRSAARRAAVERVRASLPPSAVTAPDPARARRLREAATAVAIDIGE